MLDKLLDSYTHYRKKVGLGRVQSMYRAFYYETRHKEPWSTTAYDPDKDVDPIHIEDYYNGDEN